MILKGFIALFIGLALLWIGWRNWRYRDDCEAIPWIENEVLSAIEEEPLPRTLYDRAWRRIQAGLGLVLGIFFAGIGLLLILELGD